MAKHDYIADSAPLPPLPLHPGVPGNHKEDPVKPVSFPALPVNDTFRVPAAYVLAGGWRAYVGKTADCGRRLQDHDAPDPKPSLSGLSPTTTFIN
jgi:hypothetical protein